MFSLFIVTAQPLPKDSGGTEVRKTKAAPTVMDMGGAGFQRPNSIGQLLQNVWGHLNLYFLVKLKQSEM